MSLQVPHMSYTPCRCQDEVYVEGCIQDRCRHYGLIDGGKDAVCSWENSMAQKYGHTAPCVTVAELRQGRTVSRMTRSVHDMVAVIEEERRLASAT